MSTRGSIAGHAPTIAPPSRGLWLTSSSRPRVALHLQRQHRPDIPDVELLLDDLRLERRRVLGLERAREVAERDADRLVEAEHLRPVLGLARVVLLPVGHADLRLGGEQDARQRSVDARLPGARVAGGLAVLELGRVLAEVPEVAVVVLRVPVERVLDGHAVLGHEVVDDPRLDTHNRARPVGHRYLDALLALAVDPHGSGRHRPERMVDLGAEARRVDLDRGRCPAAARTCPRRRSRRPG